MHTSMHERLSAGLNPCEPCMCIWAAASHARHARCCRAHPAPMLSADGSVSLRARLLWRGVAVHSEILSGVTHSSRRLSPARTSQYPCVFKKRTQASQVRPEDAASWQLTVEVMHVVQHAAAIGLGVQHLGWICGGVWRGRAGGEMDLAGKC